MAGLWDRRRYVRERGQRMGKFAAILQWEMRMDSKLKMPLSRATSAALTAFLWFGLCVLGFCCFEKTYGSVSLFLT